MPRTPVKEGFVMAVWIVEAHISTADLRTVGFALAFIRDGGGSATGMLLVHQLRGVYFPPLQRAASTVVVAIHGGVADVRAHFTASHPVERSTHT